LVLAGQQKIPDGPPVGATMSFTNGEEAFKGVGAPSLKSEVSGECRDVALRRDDDDFSSSNAFFIFCISWI
jgi:hypothetical protein